jgi:hypothetical protein
VREGREGWQLCWDDFKVRDEGFRHDTTELVDGRQSQIFQQRIKKFAFFSSKFQSLFHISRTCTHWNFSYASQTTWLKCFAEITYPKCFLWKCFIQWHQRIQLWWLFSNSVTIILLIENLDQIKDFPKASRILTVLSLDGCLSTSLCHGWGYSRQGWEIKTDFEGSR